MDLPADFFYVKANSRQRRTLYTNIQRILVPEIQIFVGFLLTVLKVEVQSMQYLSKKTANSFYEN
jgi:hypothetical protein